jgi:protocatechuate 3,4-dioxygenase beta subunit
VQKTREDIMRLLRKIGLTAVLLGVLGFGSIWIGTDTASAGPYTGVIYGTVTNEAGEAVANANVEIYRRMGGYDYRYTSVRTDGGGQYRFSNLDIARDYKLGVNGSPYPYLTEYFDNKKDLNSADVFNLTDGVETNIDFVLAAYGSLSGTVTNEAGETIQGIRITAYDTTNRSVGSGSTDASGNYTIRNIPPGQYKMSTSSAYTKGYLDEYYNDKIDEESADPVQVVSSQETPGINFILTKGGVISGKITDASGLPVSNPYTSLYQEELRFYKYKFIMESDGISYRVIGLPTGSYSLQAKAGTVYPYTFIPEFYNDRTALEVADAIPVTVGQEVTGIDFSLELNGRVTGQVTDDAGNLLLYTSITIYSPSGSVVSGGSTGSSGTYVSITPPGTYYVHARGPCAWENGQYICYHKEYYDDAPDKLSAQLVTVASGVDTNIDFALSKGGSMAGRITDEDGNPLSDIYVFVYDTEWNYIDDTWNVDENGNYEITNLRAGDYHVQAYSYIPDSWGDPGDYLIEYYNDVKDWTMSVPVRVEANVQTTGIDFALTLGGSISGTVLDDSGNILPLSGYDLMVDAIDSNWESVTLGLTNDDGTYRIGGLLSGRYYVRTDSTYFGWEQNPDVIDEYYDDTVDWQDAKALSVKVGKDTPNINFNITLTGSGTTPTYEYGTVSGRVLDEAGNPIITTSGIYIYAYDSSGNYTGSGYTQNGYYTMNVTAGTRFLKTWVNNGSYMPEYYNDKQSLETADPVIVNANAETGGIDFVLARSGSISGRITDDSGNPLSGNIIVYDSQWNYVRYGYSDSSGYYTAYGPLPTGSYYVRAEHFYGSENLPTYYGNTIEQANALLVGVTVGQDTPNIDISLIKGGSISGVITDESSGSPVRGIGVTAYDAQWVYTRSSSTDSDGRYKITALTAGDYYLEATDNSGKYFDEYYNNKTTRETADTVSVALGQETTAINLALARTGSITGIVTDEYGMPVGGALQ